MNHLKGNKYARRLCEQTGEAVHWRAAQVLVDGFRAPGETLEGLARRVGVSQILFEELPFDGGVYATQRGATVVRINSLSSAPRQRFTLAHEIAHLMLRESSIAKKAVCSSPQLERACDLVAGEILMPAQQVAEVAQRIGAPSTIKLKAVAREFQASLHATARRLHEDLKLWPQSIGLWRFERVPRQKWFVGKRPWKTLSPNFAAFRYALSSYSSIRTRESHTEESCPEGDSVTSFSLEVLNLGHNNLLGMVA
jgi:Zn-dependent peptidase ImmA (M78 family)